MSDFHFRADRGGFRPVVELWDVFVGLVVVPFREVELLWGIVPLYFGWLVNELTPARANHRTALQTGFGLLWAGMQWSWQYFRDHPGGHLAWDSRGMAAANVLVTAVVLILGAVAFWSGLTRCFPRGFRFLGHSRFSTYFTIVVFPIQAGYLAWSWERAAAMVVFAVPIWLGLHYGMAPFRR